MFAFWGSYQCRAERVEVLPVHDSSQIRSLNGVWKFKYEAGACSETASLFYSSGFQDNDWAEISVPSNWELQGFAEPKYASVPQGNGYYRRFFRIPADWNNSRVLLRFEGALYGIEVYVNGVSVGNWASSFNPVTFDITDAIRKDMDNVLAVRVNTHPKGWEFDTTDDWALSGIYRDVILMAVPPTHFQHYTARTKLLSNGNAQLDITVHTKGLSGQGIVKGILIDPAKNIAGEFTFDIKDNMGSVSVDVENPRLWTAETPFLYNLDLKLMEDGNERQQVHERIGLREISIKDGVLLLNGRPFKLRGFNHLDILPTGHYATEEMMRKDLDLIQAANGNFIRTHYPPDSRMLELADELGIYFIVEVPFDFGDEHLKDISYQDILYTRARATVLRDENHPSVIIWSVGNENPNTPLTYATGRLVKELDPTRPICFPQMAAYFARTYPELPEWVDIYAPHYPSLNTIKTYAETLKRPVIFTEYAHAMGLASEGVQSEWPIMQASKHIAGGAIWEFQDQGILRQANSRIGKEQARLAVYPNPDHLYDTNGNAGMDGVVYSDRVPQPDYWLVRKAFSPVQVSLCHSDIKAGKQTIEVPVENHFDFRSLDGISLKWNLRRNGKSIQNGNVKLTAEAHESETLPISINVPKGADSDILVLELSCQDRNNTPFYERTIQLNLGNTTIVNAANSDLPTGSVSFGQDEQQITIKSPQGKVIVSRITGEMQFENLEGAVVAKGPYLHAGRRYTESERIRRVTDKIWPDFYWANQSDELWSEGENIIVKVIESQTGGLRVVVNGRYVRTDYIGQTIEGMYAIDVLPQGPIEVTYDYHFVNASGLVLEAGLSFLTPGNASEFRWIGDGPYQAYPDKDILNEFGIYHLNREDIEFQGNRRAVDLAVMADTTGSGIAIAGEKMDIAVERVEAGTLFRHNALISGRGFKGRSPEIQVLADQTKKLRGRFTLILLSNKWPKRIETWLGGPTKTVPVFKPYYQSYDQ